MNTTRVTFQNQDGHTLSGKLELPLDREPHNYALFAHCFTCTKNLTAITNITREVTRAGFGVLSFDFTGLGESEGNFADTNFSGNVDDLMEAAFFLKENYTPPTLIIGHSLGGAAVIYAAARLSFIQAIATIGAPSDPSHVMRLLKDSEAEIEANGKAVVQLGGRFFTIKKQLLDDLKKHALTEVVREVDKALLILHSPQDVNVSINNAERLFVAARHPKSFISLDKADHLLSRREDALYVGSTIAAWAARYLDIPDAPTIPTVSRVAASLDAADKFTTYMKLGSHSFIADEPKDFGGNDFGPSPYDYLSGALAACTAMTVQMYARQKKWDVKNVTVHINHSRQHALDCEACEEVNAKIDTFSREISFEGDLDDAQRQRLLAIADRCPVHKTLHSTVQVVTKLKE